MKHYSMTQEELEEVLSNLLGSSLPANFLDIFDEELIRIRQDLLTSYRNEKSTIHGGLAHQTRAEGSS